MPAKLALDEMFGPGVMDHVQRDGPIVITAAVIALEGMDGDGERFTWTVWDDRSSLATSVGLVRILGIAAEIYVTRTEGDE